MVRALPYVVLLAVAASAGVAADIAWVVWVAGVWRGRRLAGRRRRGRYGWQRANTWLCAADGCWSVGWRWVGDINGYSRRADCANRQQQAQAELSCRARCSGRRADICSVLGVVIVLAQIMFCRSMHGRDVSLGVVRVFQYWLINV